MTGTLYGYLHLTLSNRIGENPSGCWARLAEIENMHKAWLEQEIVEPSGGDYARAWQVAHSLAAAPPPAAKPSP